ncbi:Adenine/guanine phosphoribosyltransferase [Desulfosporosinus sp. I2]|uniref:phosphoribosyltransferase family protein n=1 Tax=Desulfosporosinus sp. I2 TaxID=1617025 RepID=UPI0005EDAC68|nr:phosphoribosyltransferase family protein [Desulfosporosinus sp. I2]KJR48976.1 Adenine/guanine phosphoribosyltransferase [Desulfosporosinus sp. I2]
MSNTISLVSSPKIFTYNLEGQKVIVKLNHNHFDFELPTLFSLAARQNKKRGFLFVSNVLGKHVPVNPYIPLLAGAALAVQLQSKLYGLDHTETQAIIQALKGLEQAEKVYNTVQESPHFALPEETLFIGFAETATGLGHAVFSLFENAHYLHTTREQITRIDSELNFSEDHSHAVHHRCYPLNTESLLTSKTIVLVDDEITTGNTALNIIRELHGKFPKSEYVVLSLLDWRTPEERANYRDLERQLDTKIHSISLLEGELTIIGDPIIKTVNPINLTKKLAPLKRGVVIERQWFNGFDLVQVSSEDSLGNKNRSPYLKLTGRFGVSSRENREIVPYAKKIAEELQKNRTGEKTLCLGTGEFMYFPMLISAKMGRGIRYHSTTRSPIYPLEKPDYGIQNGFSFDNPDDASITNYVYNVPLGYYDEVYLFLERDVAQEKLKSLRTTFGALEIPRIVLVICVSFSPVEFGQRAFSD